jgi:hypothetical protein
LLKYIIVILLGNMITQEIHSSNFDKSILFSYDLHFELYVVISVPVCSWGYEVFIFNFNQFSNNLQSNHMKLFWKLISLQHLQNCRNDRVKCEIFEWLHGILWTRLNNVFYSQFNISDPKDELFELYFNHMSHFWTILDLLKHLSKLARLRTFSCSIQIEVTQKTNGWLFFTLFF